MQKSLRFELCYSCLAEIMFVVKGHLSGTNAQDLPSLVFHWRMACRKIQLSLPDFRWFLSISRSHTDVMFHKWRLQVLVAVAGSHSSKAWLPSGFSAWFSTGFPRLWSKPRWRFGATLGGLATALSPKVSLAPSQWGAGWFTVGGSLFSSFFPVHLERAFLASSQICQMNSV